MDKKLPGIYANKIEKDLNNNEKVYYSKNEIELDNEVKTEPKIVENINQKINKIFNSNNYIYKADVIIKLKNETIEKRIVGKNRTHLITIENELIPIQDIVDISVK